MILAAMLFGLPAAAQAATIVTHETEKYFFQEGRMEKYDGQYEYTYFVDPEKDTFVRTRVYDYQTKKVTPDETVYQVYKDLNSHPGNAERFGQTPVIRAVGRTGPDTVETLIVGEKEVVALQSAGTTSVVSRARRLT
jgi:hypothetical protein